MAALAAFAVAPAAAAPPSLTLKASPTLVGYGATTTLSGALSTGRSGQSVEIQAQQCGQSAFKKLAVASTGAGGAFTFAAKPTSNTSYEAKLKAATSPSVAVKVTPIVALRRRATGRFAVSVTAAQSFVGKYVAFQRRRGAKWVTLKKVTLAAVKTTVAPTEVSSAGFRLKLPAGLRVRAVLPASQAGACYGPARSGVVRS
ncbi:MAG TPA: hypothetical protein VF002_07965 [Gaiellaceae bacterium]